MARNMIAARTRCEAVAVAAQHARKYRHRTVVELTHVNLFDHTG